MNDYTLCPSYDHQQSFEIILISVTSTAPVLGSDQSVEQCPSEDLQIVFVEQCWSVSLDHCSDHAHHDISMIFVAFNSSAIIVGC